MPRIHGASGPVTIECFSHLSAVKLTSVSNTDNCWHLPVTPVIQVGSVPYTLMAPAYAVHHCLPDPYTSVDLICQATESRESWSSFSSSWSKAGTLYSCSWSEYSLSDPCSGRTEFPSPGSRKAIPVLLCWEIVDCLLVSLHELS